MYLDLKKKQQRSNNIIIIGLPAGDNDAKSVIDLLQSEFECDIEDWPGVDVIRCKRLGKQQTNKIQPLLVTLGSRDQATYYVKNARYLRSSNITAVRDGVYINADLTPAEAKAAYELRLKRKQRQQRERSTNGLQSDQMTTEPTRRVRLVYRSTAANSTSLQSKPSKINDIRSHPHDELSLLNTASHLVWSSHQPQTPAGEIVNHTVSSLVQTSAPNSDIAAGLNLQAEPFSPVTDGIQLSPDPSDLPSHQTTDSRRQNTPSERPAYASEKPTPVKFDPPSSQNSSDSGRLPNAQN
jgi:hypothetical protein